jgi:4'-phosphopantetheinyl transferase
MLTGAALHVWHADLAAVGAGLAGLLAPEERERAARIARPQERELWARGRGALRALLGRYLQADPHALVLLIGEHGKPAIENDVLQFNLSHSGGCALYAFTLHAPVGVDLELLRDPTRRVRTDYCALAARAFGTDAAERLRALPLVQREAEFMRLWTQREAALKQRGAGIGSGGALGPPPTWEAELDVGPGAIAAVAAAQAPGERCLWRWEDSRAA